MAEKGFTLIPMEVPKIKKPSKYEATVKEFLSSKDKSVRINAPSINLNSLYSGFYRVIKKDYSDKVSVSRIDGELYIEKL